jgi:phage repressor protein C with HTH and peptisase S24 domain
VPLTTILSILSTSAIVHSFRTPEFLYVTCVPLVPLAAAAGLFGEQRDASPQEWDWVEVDTHRRLQPGMFVSQVVGKSMEPGIPDGSYCLFAGPVTGTRQGRTVLVQLHEDTDPETGGRYTVKRYESETSASADGTWRHVKVSLRPTNPEFRPIELKSEDEDSVLVIAELLEVLG